MNFASENPGNFHPFQCLVQLLLVYGNLQKRSLIHRYIFHPCLLYITNRFGPYFVEPVIAGLDPKTDEPYIATMDLIGCPMETKDFVVGGTCSEQLYGMCESLWNPDMVGF